jgi:NAD(P)-dependent dehydrogenase (short-subunit alcohol dehydrogenase family)
MFQGKVVAITGAGSGIGRALAMELAPLGARLALSDINQTTLAETMQLLPTVVEARAYPLDVASREAVHRFAADVQRDFGAAHFIFNNAGTGVFATVENVEIEEIEKVLNINLWGTIYGTKAFLPIMLAQKEGCIVNISSGFGLVAAPCQAAYCMSKFAVRALTETLWHELLGTGVRAVVVHPGGINTNIDKNSLRAQHVGALEQKLMKGVKAKLTTTPQDCAHQIIRGLRSGKNRLLVGAGAKATHRLSRLLPNSYGVVLRRQLGF